MKEIGDRMAAFLVANAGKLGDEALSLAQEWGRATAPPSKPKYTSLKEALRVFVYEDSMEFDMYHFGANNWPQIPMDPDEADEIWAEENCLPDTELLGTENYKFIELTDTKLRMCCGDDSQEPRTLELELVDGELTVAKVEEGWEEGMDREEFVKLVMQD